MASNVALLGISTLVALLICEYGLRLLYPQNVGVWYLTQDGIGILRPNFKVHLSKFNQDVEINSLGMRDRERTIVKGKGVFRILVLGDSFMEAFQVSYQQSFPSLLEQALRQKIRNAPSEVLNASLSGYGTDDELTYLIRYGMKLEPDLILIAMTLHNDISDNLRRQFHFLKDGQLVARPLTTIPPVTYTILQVKSYLAAHSHLYQLFLLFWRAPEIKSEKSRLDHHVAELFHVPPTDELKEGIELTRQLVRKVKSIGRQIGAQTAVFLIPLAMQLSDENLSAFLASQKLTKGEILLHQPQTLMSKIGAEEGIEIIDLLPGFTQWIQSNRGKRELYLEGDGHWNAGGHALAATIVAEELLRRNLIGIRSSGSPGILAREQALVEM